MNTQKHNKDLKFCVYCGIRNFNYKIGCKDCLKIMFKKTQRKYYLKNREKIIVRNILYQQNKKVKQ